jgi:hypothetical protein
MISVFSCVRPNDTMITSTAWLAGTDVPYVLRQTQVSCFFFS